MNKAKNVPSNKDEAVLVAEGREDLAIWVQRGASWHGWILRDGTRLALRLAMLHPDRTTSAASDG